MVVNAEGVTPAVVFVTGLGQSLDTRTFTTSWLHEKISVPYSLTCEREKDLDFDREKVGQTGSAMIEALKNHIAVRKGSINPRSMTMEITLNPGGSWRRDQNSIFVALSDATGVKMVARTDKEWVASLRDEPMSFPEVEPEEQHTPAHGVVRSAVLAGVTLNGRPVSDDVARGLVAAA